MLEALAATNARQNFRFLVLQVFRNDDGDRLADHLLGRIAEQPLGARIPADDDAVQILADDRIVGGFDNTGELPARLLALALLGDVEQRRDPAASVALRIELGPIGDVKAAPAGLGEIEFAFEFQRLAAQHLLNIRTQRVETLLPDHFRDRLADDIVARPADHLRVGLADEAVSQIAAASHQHEGRAIDDGLQFRFAGAQRVFGALAFGQFLEAADGTLDTAGSVQERRGIHQHRNSRAIRPFDDEFGADDGLAGS